VNGQGSPRSRRGAEKELVLSCPLCGQPNFTARGLRAHQCPKKSTPGREKHTGALTREEWRAAVEAARQAQALNTSREMRSGRVKDHEVINFRGQLVPVLGTVGGSKEESEETARNIEAFLARSPAESVELIVTTRYYGGAYIARCNGCQSSSTNTAEWAALSAAEKHARKIPVPEGWTAEARCIGGGVYMVTYSAPGGGQ
jgi:hypothetical protein